MTLASGDLTTLADAQAYLNATIPAAILSPMITRLSRSLQSYLNRGLLVPKTYVQQFNGTGTTGLVLPEYPLLSLNSLTISGASTSIAPQSGSDVTPANPVGYRFQPWDGVPPGNPAVLELVGGSSYIFGNQNIVASYRAGYQTSDEVPDSTVYTPVQPYGRWATDEGVTYASSGVALTSAIRTSTAPTVGVYYPPLPEASTVVNTYWFNSTDVSTGLLIAYGYVPADLEQIILEIIASRNVFRLNPGVISQSLAAQESIGFGSPFVGAGRGFGFANYSDALMPYKSVLPPALGANV